MFTAYYGRCCDHLVGLFGPLLCTTFIALSAECIISIDGLYAYAVNPHKIQGRLSQLERVTFREMIVDTTDHQLGFRLPPMLYNGNYKLPEREKEITDLASVNSKDPFELQISATDNCADWNQYW